MFVRRLERSGKVLQVFYVVSLPSPEADWPSPTCPLSSIAGGRLKIHTCMLHNSSVRDAYM